MIIMEVPTSLQISKPKNYQSPHDNPTKRTKTDNVTAMVDECAFRAAGEPLVFDQCRL